MVAQEAKAATVETTTVATIAEMEVRVVQEEVEGQAVLPRVQPLLTPTQRVMEATVEQEVKAAMEAIITAETTVEMEVQEVRVEMVDREVPPQALQLPTPHRVVKVVTVVVAEMEEMEAIITAATTLAMAVQEVLGEMVDQEVPPLARIQVQ